MPFKKSCCCTLRDAELYIRLVGRIQCFNAELHESPNASQNTTKWLCEGAHNENCLGFFYL